MAEVEVEVGVEVLEQLGVDQLVVVLELFELEVLVENLLVVVVGSQIVFVVEQQ